MSSVSPVPLKTSGTQSKERSKAPPFVASAVDTLPSVIHQLPVATSMDGGTSRGGVPTTLAADEAVSAIQHLRRVRYGAVIAQTIAARLSVGAAWWLATAPRCSAPQSPRTYLQSSLHHLAGIWYWMAGRHMGALHPHFYCRRDGDDFPTLPPTSRCGQFSVAARRRPSSGGR